MSGEIEVAFTGVCVRAPKLKTSRVHAAGARIRYWRKDVRRMTLRTLSDAIGSGPGTLSRLETGHEGVRLERYWRIKRLLAKLQALGYEAQIAPVLA